MNQRRLCTMFYAVVLTLSTVSSQSCITAILDPQNVSSYDPSTLVPLFRQHLEISSYSDGEQWLFPNLQFTCYGILTKWIFTGVPGQPITSCRVELGTWRLNTFITTSTVYEQRSTTERRTVTVTITQDGQTFTYELSSQVLVEPGDIVGVELGRFCAPFEDLDNVLSLNISGTGSSYLSYRKVGSGTRFSLLSTSVTPVQDFVPLIGAVVDVHALPPTEPVTVREYTGSIDITTHSAITTGRATIAPEADESGGTSVTTITVAVFGSIIGVLVTIIVCICVWCIIRHVIYNKERQRSDDSAQQQQQHPQDGSSNESSMQLNEAYTEPTVWHTAIGTPEQEVQLNQAYGVRGEGCVGVDAEETGDEYERMYAAAVNRHEMLRPNAMELGKCSNIAKPGEYETPVQQQENVYTELK